jgi:hypothetical protein
MVHSITFGTQHKAGRDFVADRLRGLEVDFSPQDAADPLRGLQDAHRVNLSLHRTRHGF